MNGHAWFHLHLLCWAVRTGKDAKNSKWKYVPSGIRTHAPHSTTGKSALQTARPNWLDIKWSFIVLQYPDVWKQMDMWYYMTLYEIGYGL